jgi:cbb3-type cytochrome oxidase subunit 3
MLTQIAHNGINHTNEAQAAAHQAGSTFALIAVTLLLICIIVVIMRRVDKSARQETEDTDNDR